MDNRTKAVTAVQVVAMLVAGAYLVWDHTSDRKPVVTCKAFRAGDYGDMFLDATPSDMNVLNLSYGMDLRVEFNGRQYTAIYVTQFAGIPAFSMFLNYLGDEKMYDLGVFSAGLIPQTGIKVGDTVKISVIGMNKYYERIPKYLQGETDDPGDYPSYEAFANFREVGGGDLKGDLIYRSQTPFGTQKRPVQCNELLEEHGMDYLFCMSLTEENAREFAAQHPDMYVSKMFAEDRVYASLLSPSVHSSPEDIRWFVDQVLDSDGQIGISCLLGKDRTGMYVLFLQTIAGATFEEVKEEFLRSMCDLYHVEKGSDEYEAIYEMHLLRSLYLLEHPEGMKDVLSIDWSGVELKDFDLYGVVTGFLINSAGVSQEKLDLLKEKLTA